jgi:hypothetical protein
VVDENGVRAEEAEAARRTGELGVGMDEGAAAAGGGGRGRWRPRAGRRSSA